MKKYSYQKLQEKIAKQKGGDWTLDIEKGVKIIIPIDIGKHKWNQKISKPHTFNEFLMIVILLTQIISHHQIDNHSTCFYFDHRPPKRNIIVYSLCLFHPCHWIGMLGPLFSLSQ